MKTTIAWKPSSPPKETTRDDSFERGSCWCGGTTNKQQKRVEVLLILLATFVIVGLVPEWHEVSRLLSFRSSLQIIRFTKYQSSNQTTTEMAPRTIRMMKPNNEDNNTNSAADSDGWVHYQDLPLMNDHVGSSKDNLAFPLEDEWLLSTFPYPEGTDSTNTNIPKLLHKVIFNRNGEFPPGFFANHNSSSKGTTSQQDATTSDNNNDETSAMISLEDAHRSWHDFNPNYTIRYYNLRLARVYLGKYFHPVFLRAFDCIEAFAGKADFFRYTVLYREGGFYSDWKQVCLVDGLLDQLASDNCTWFSFLDHALQRGAMQNAFIGSIPLHPVLAFCIQAIFSHVQRKFDEDIDDVFWITGPRLLGAAVKTMGLEVGVNGTKFGSFRYPPRRWDMRFFYMGEMVVRGKCHGCGWNQNWTSGNDYHEKFRNHEYFCPDAQSLLATTSA